MLNKSFTALCAAFSVFAISSCGVSETPQKTHSDIDMLLTSLTLEQKVAQMIQAEIRHVTPDDVRKYGIGSILNGGGSFPYQNKQATISDWQQLASDFREASLDASQGSAGIPIIWGTDAVHGHNNVVGATLFPHNIGLGAANDEELIFRIGQATAKEVAATGIDWIFAPTVAVVQDDRWGRTYESYSEDGDIVGRYATQIVRGLQSINLGATVKHFIGDGGSTRGDDQGNVELEIDELLAVHGAGYVAAIDAGVQSVMSAFNSWNGQKIHGHKTLLTDVLRGRLGFEGVVVTDWNGHGQVAGCSNSSCAQAINAGVDLVMVTEDWKAFLANTIAQVEAGEIPMSRIDDAVRRILTMKKSLGLFREDFSVLRQPASIVGSAEHRAIAREAVRKSLVLLKNQQQLLPLDPSGHYLVLGEAADNIGQQSGGWTVTWQGTGNVNDDFPGGNSVYQGIKTTIEQDENGGSVALNEWKKPQQPDAVIWVFGETPYAEGMGDLEHLDFVHPSNGELAKVKGYVEQGIPVIAVFLSGRPMWVNEELNLVDAFIAAWLPGSEGEGVADVIIADNKGKPRYDFTGRLSFGWPNQPINVNDHSKPVQDLAFERGYGLSYQDSVVWQPLTEQASGFVVEEDSVIFNRGLRDPWGLIADGKRVTAMPFMVSESLAVKAVDINVQEDGLAFDHRGANSSVIRINSAVAQTLNLPSDGYMQMELFVAKGNLTRLSVAMNCEAACDNSVDLMPTARAFEPNAWQKVAIPVQCLMTEMSESISISDVVSMEIAGDVELYLQDLRLTPTTTVIPVSCSGDR